MKIFVAVMVVAAAVLFAQPASAQCTTTSTLCDLRAQIEDSITNSRTTLRAQLEDKINNKANDLRAWIEDAIVNSRTTLRAQLEARIDDSTQSVFDAIAADGADALKHRIEEALRANRRIAGYYLPEADGGHQALARQIVSDTIAAVAASGESTNQAALRLASADSDITAGRHKRAWGYLSQAYFEAIKTLGEVQ